MISTMSESSTVNNSLTSTMHNLYHFKTRAMGSDISVHYTGEENERIEMDVCDRLGSLEGCWSRFDPSSELSLLNHGAGGASRMSQDLAVALRCAVDAWRITEGRFDPTVGSAMNQLGYDRDWHSISSESTPKGVGLPAPGCMGIEFIEDMNMLVAPPGIHFDLGGLGKGLAADIIVNESTKYNLEGISISVGGDLRCSGAGPDGQPWMVQVLDAQGNRLAVTRFDNGGAIATSSPSAKQFSDGRHHIIDPHTGVSTTSGISHVSVIAKNCATAEIWTKAAMTLRADDALELLAGHSLSAVIVDSYGVVRTTSSSTHPIGTKS